MLCTVTKIGRKMWLFCPIIEEKMASRNKFSENFIFSFLLNQGYILATVTQKWCFPAFGENLTVH